MSFRDVVDTMTAAEVFPGAAPPAEKTPVAKASDFKPALIKAIVERIRLGDTDAQIHATVNTITTLNQAGLDAFIPAGANPSNLNVVKPRHIRRIRARWMARMAALAAPSEGP